MTLAADARAEQNEIRCETARDEANKQLAAKNVAVLVDLIGSMKSKCSGFEGIEPVTAELLYKTGLDLYKRGEFADALKKFRTAVKFAPQHELASQYIELTQSKLQVSVDRLLLDWRKNFEAHEFALAAAEYLQLASYNDGNISEAMNQIRSEYRKALSALVDSSNRACANSDAATMNTIRGQVSELLPDPSIGEDILAQMTTCAKKGCLQMEAPLALIRLKTRVDPEIPSAYQNFLRHSPVSVRVQIRIDEKGDVVAGEAHGSNRAITEAIRTAVARWKFTPIMMQDGPRCVDTEIPIVINP